MHIGDRLFPYPVLNNNEKYSGYLLNEHFGLEIKFNNDNAVYQRNGKIILKDVKYTLSNEFLRRLIADQKAQTYLVVECSYTSFREKYILTESEQDILVDKSDLSGEVQVSAFIVAVEDISQFYSDSFLPIYKEYEFNIDKYAILAADDGFVFKVDFEVATVDKVSSIFSILTSSEDNDVINYSCTAKKIVITMSKKCRDNYELIKSAFDYRSVVFAMLVVPILTACIDEVKNKAYEDMEALTDEYIWFKAVMKSYAKDRNEDLSMEKFKELTSFELAQIVMGYSSTLGLEALSKSLLTDERGEINESD